MPANDYAKATCVPDMPRTVSCGMRGIVFQSSLRGNCDKDIESDPPGSQFLPCNKARFTHEHTKVDALQARKYRTA